MPPIFSKAVTFCCLYKNTMKKKGVLKTDYNHPAKHQGSFL